MVMSLRNWICLVLVGTGYYCIFGACLAGSFTGATSCEDIYSCSVNISVCDNTTTSSIKLRLDCSNSSSLVSRYIVSAEYVYGFNATDVLQCQPQQKLCSLGFRVETQIKACLWKRSFCIITDKEREMNCGVPGRPLTTGLVAVNFQCVPEDTIYSVCGSVNETTDSDHGHIISPNHPNNVQTGTDCSITLNNDRLLSEISLQSKVFELQDCFSSECKSDCDDYLYVSYVDIGSGQRIEHCFTGTDQLATLNMITDGQVLLHFHKLGSTPVKGFAIEYRRNPSNITVTFPTEPTTEDQRTDPYITSSVPATTPASVPVPIFIVVIAAILILAVLLLAALIIIRIKPCAGRKTTKCCNSEPSSDNTSMKSYTGSTL